MEKGYREDDLEQKTIYVVPYDWRKSNIETVNNYLIPDLKNARSDFISRYNLPNNANVDIDVIAHSMGGLVARYYIENSTQISGVTIRNLFMLGTPNYGSPKGYFYWEGGVSYDTGTPDDLTIPILNRIVGKYGEYYAKNVAKKDWAKESPGWKDYWKMAGVQKYIPSLKQTLPVKKDGWDYSYLKEESGGYKDLNELKYAKNDFLIDLNSNEKMRKLYDRTKEIHTIRGSKDTIYEIHVKPSEMAYPRWYDGQPIKLSNGKYDYLTTKNGDGTVVWNSTLIPEDPNNPLKVNNYETIIDSSHTYINTNQKTLDYISRELNLGAYDKQTQFGYVYIAFDLQCPADLLVTDPNGRKIGYLNGQFINQIGSNAMVMGEQGDGQFILILNPIQGKYNASVLGQGEGNFDLFTWSYAQDNVHGERFFGYLKPGLNLNYGASFNLANEQKLAIEVPDKIAPTSVLTVDGLQGQNQWYVTPVELKLSAIDVNGIGPAKIEYSLDGGQNWNDYSLPVMLNNSGVYEIKYRSIDFFGNEEVEKTVSIKVDLSPPITNLTVEGQLGNGSWYVSNIKVVLQANDDENGSGVEKTVYSLNGGITWNKYSEPISLSNGKHNLLFKSIDNAGLIEADQSKEVWIDTEKPETITSTEGVNGNNGWFLSDVQVNLTATDNLSGVSSIVYSLDYGNTWLPYSTTLLITTNGKNGILYKAVDEAGNIEDRKEIIIPIDKVAPTTSISLVGTQGNSPWFISNVNIVLDSNDNPDGAGVEKIEYSYDKQNWILYNGVLNLDEEGITSLYYRATDKAGNVEIYKQRDIYIDKTAPNINIISPIKDVYLFNEPLTVNFISTDSISGVKSNFTLLNGESVTDGQTVILNKLGPYEFIVESVDVAGNKSTQIVKFDVKYLIEWLPPVSVKDDKVFNANSTVPVKFTAYAFNNVPQINQSIMDPGNETRFGRG